MQQNQNTDPLVDHLYKNYYKDKLTKEQISKKLYSNPESYEGGLRALYKDVYKGKVESYDQMKGLYQQKYGDPFAKKKVQSEQPTTPPSEPSQESLDQPMAQEPQMDLPVNPFQDAAPLSLQEQQIGATLGQGGILSGQPLTPEGSVTASKIQQARIERLTNDVGQVTEQASVGGDYEQTLEKVQEKTFGERLATAGRVGLGKIVTMAAKIPGYVDEINLGGKLLEGLFKYGIDKKLQNKFERGELTKEELEKERQRRYKSNPYITNPVKEGMIDALEENAVVKSIENFEKQWGEYKAESDKTITRHLAEGNFKEAGLQTMVSVVESLPVTLAAMFGGPVGLAGITMGTAAEKEDKLAEDNPEMSDAARITNATLTGLFEGGTELVTAGIGAKTIKAFAAEQGEEAVKEAVAKTFKDQVGNTLKKIGGKTYVEEGLSEGANAFGEAVVDWATGASDTLDLSAVGDAIIVGGASGKLVGGVAQDVAKVSKNIKNRQADNRAVQIAEKSKETATERLKRREKIDGGVKDRAMEVVEFAKANGVKDIDEAFDQYQQQLPENVREEVLKDGVDIVKIAKTNAAIDEELQDTQEAQQDEAPATTPEGEVQAEEAVQEEQVAEEQPGTEEVAEPMDETENLPASVQPDIEAVEDNNKTSDMLFRGNETKEEREYLKEEKRKEREYAKEEKRKEREFARQERIRRRGGVSLEERLRSGIEEIEQRREKNRKPKKESPKRTIKEEPVSSQTYDETTYKGRMFKDIEANGTPEQKAFIKIFKKVGADQNTNVDAGATDNPNALGQTQIKSHEFSPLANILIDESTINDISKRSGVDAKKLRRYVQTHELVHAIAVNVMDSEKSIYPLVRGGLNNSQIADRLNRDHGSNLTEKDIESIDELNKRFDEYVRIAQSNQDLFKGWGADYGLTNRDEFVAELFSNPDFRKGLNKIKYKDTTLLDRIIKSISDFIKRIFSSDPASKFSSTSGSLLESAIKDGIKVMDIYQRMNQHKVDAVNRIRNNDNLNETEKDQATTFYMQLSNQEPENVQKTRKYIKAKLDKLADADIVADAADAFDIDVDDAIRLLEEIAGRDFRPDINTIQAVGETQVGIVGFFFRIREKMTGKTIDPEVLATYMKPFDRIRIAGQDKYLGLKRYQQAIEKVYGKNIPDEMNAYILREQANSVSADFQIQLFVDMFGQERGKIGFDKALKGSLVYQMNKQDDIKWDQVNDYSYYRHAIQFNDRVTDRRAKRYQKAQDRLLELNQELAQLDQDATPDAYKNIEEQIKQVNRLAEQNKPLDNPPSGVDSDVAARKVAEMEAQHPNIKAWADTFRDKLMGEYIYILEKNNLVSHERIEHLRNGTASDSDVVFDYYVPLKVKDTAFDNEFEQESPGLGTIFDFGLYKLQGSETNYGKSERHRPLDVALTLVVKAKRTAEINNAIRGYADLLKTYGSQEVSVIDGQVVSKVNAIGDVVQGSVVDYSGKVANAKNKVTYINEKGKMSHLIFKEENHPVYVGLTTRPQKMKGWIEKAAKGIQKFNNIKRNLITQFRPSFALTNAMRDLQDATFNTIVDNKGQRTKATRKFISNLAKAHKYFNLDRLMPGETGDLPVVGNIGKTGSKVKIGDEKISFAEAWIEMQAAGGAMSWGKYLHNFEEEIADIQKRVDVIEKGISATGKAYDKARQALQLLSEFNEGMENATRLAAYVTAKQLGASTQSAAAVSRDITLNFQRKGTSTGNISLFYLFLNAGIQGVERGMRAMKNGGLLKSAAIVTGIGYMGRVMLHELYKGADDGDREKFEGMIMNPYIRAQKSILPFPWTKEPIMIPKPYSMLRVFLSLGEGLADNQYGYNTMIDVYGDFNMNLLTAVDPIGGFSGSATNLVPGALIRTKVEVWADKQWSGSNILYMKAGENIPSYKKYSKNTDESYVAAAQILYDNFDWNFFAPAYLEYFIEKDINMGLIKDFTGAMDEFVKATGDKRLSEIFRENLMRRAGLRIKKGSSEYVKDTGSGTKEFTVDSPPLKKSRLIPFIKPLYNPKDEDKVVMGNFFTILHKTNNLGKTPLGGLSEGEMEYLKKGYKLLMQEDLIRPSLMSRNMNNLIEKFPNEDWSWYKSYKARYK